MNAHARPTTGAEHAICAIHRQMIDAWNAGDGAAFAAPFTDDADFVTWDGTHLKGRIGIAQFIQQVLNSVVKGSRMQGHVKFVRFLTPTLAMMHSVVTYRLEGQSEASAGRDFMEFTVVAQHAGEWRAEGLLNARKLTMAQQRFWDDVESLSKVFDSVSG
jgi:uncharacterized protein (TIGR02246 family)